LRDTVVIEALSRHHACTSDRPVTTELIAETIEFLIELSGSRVESHDLTHGVIITDVLRDAPRLEFAYPADLRAAKRAPLLFDGQRSLLVVDKQGRARTELQGHRLDRLVPGVAGLDAAAAVFSHSGSLVAEATRRLGGIGFFLRSDRTLWVFADGQPLLMRRGEHWSAFPLELATAISSARTLARFAALDGATVLDLDGRLLAYGAIVTTADSQHEGARTAAATTLSRTAEIVLKVSVDGDITVFRAGEVVATLLG
jgi:hypothetical protein